MTTVQTSIAGVCRALRHADTALAHGQIHAGRAIVATLLEVLAPDGPALHAIPDPHPGNEGNRTAAPQEHPQPAEGGEPPVASQARTEADDNLPKRLARLFGSPFEFGRAINAHVTTIHDWRRTGHIPAHRHAAILSAAAERGLPVTAADLPAAPPPVPDEQIRWTEARKALMRADYETAEDMKAFIGRMNALPGLPVEAGQLSAYAAATLGLRRQPAQRAKAATKPAAAAAQARATGAPRAPKAKAAPAAFAPPTSPPIPQAEATNPAAGMAVPEPAATGRAQPLPAPAEAARAPLREDPEVALRDVWQRGDLSLSQATAEFNRRTGLCITLGALNSRAVTRKLPPRPAVPERGGRPAKSAQDHTERAPMDERDRLEAIVELKKGTSVRAVAADFGQPLSVIAALAESIRA